MDQRPTQTFDDPARNLSAESDARSTLLFWCVMGGFDERSMDSIFSVCGGIHFRAGLRKRTAATTPSVKREISVDVSPNPEAVTNIF